MAKRYKEQADQIQQYLLESGLTSAQMADRVVISAETMRKIANGYQPASPRLMSLIEQAAKTERVLSRQTHSGARGTVQMALHAQNMDIRELSNRTGYQIGVLQSVINGQGRASEKMIEAICRVLPTLEKEDLMGGSDQPLILHDLPGYGNFGSKPEIRFPKGTKARFVPLLSKAQAGALDAEHLDEGYDYSGVLAVDVADPKAFALEIWGKSMEPRLSEGDRVIVCPSWKPESGNTVIAKTVTGDVMCKLYQAKDSGKIIILSSWNDRFPPLEFSIDEIQWIYPVAQVLQNLR